MHVRVFRMTLAMLMIGAATLEGAPEDGFIGDTALVREEGSRSHTGQTQTVISANSQKALQDMGSGVLPTPLQDGSPAPSVLTLDVDTEFEVEGDGVTLIINGTPRTFRDGDPLKVKKGDKVEFANPDGQISPQNYINMVKLFPNSKSPGPGLLPPKNKIKVIDQDVWQALTPEQKKERQIYRTVTRTRYYTVFIPIYENRRAVAYPCCCWVSYSVLVGYRAERRSETTTSREPAGADYPLTDIYVDRNVYKEQGTPLYTTRLPQLCKNHYGPGAPEYPTVPVVTDPRDNPSTQVEASSETTKKPNGEVIVITKEAVATKEPIGDPDKGLPAGDLKDPGQGLNTFGNDTVYVADQLVASREKDGTYREKRPGSSQ